MNTLWSIPASAVFPAVAPVALVCADATATEAPRGTVGSLDSTGGESVPTTSFEAIHDEASFVRTPRLRPSLVEWTRKLERQYQALAEAEALGKLTEAEADELAHLADERRGLVPTRSEEEILLEHSRRLETRRLIDNLRNYVEFPGRKVPASR